MSRLLTGPGAWMQESEGSKIFGTLFLTPKSMPLKFHRRRPPLRIGFRARPRQLLGQVPPCRPGSSAPAATRRWGPPGATST
jgi:hypothetical protein